LPSITGDATFRLTHQEDLMRVVVVGGSGLIGSKLMTKLREHGQEAVNASLDTGVNLLTGEGLSEALAHADVVVDVANSPSLEGEAALSFFQAATGNVLEVEAATGVKHHIALSVVGTNRLTESGYMRAKIAQETLIRESSIPYSIVHATQFFEFVMGIANGATDGNTVRLAHVLVQPMAADDVAGALEQVANGAPRNRVVEIGGPEQFRLDDLVRQSLQARGDPREVETDGDARYFGAPLSERTLVPGEDALLGPTRYEDWLNDALAAEK
jgi:uncharacterized protein YbjT (DUF2867 family)